MPKKEKTIEFRLKLEKIIKEYLESDEHKNSCVAWSEGQFCCLDEKKKDGFINYFRKKTCPKKKKEKVIELGEFEFKSYRVKSKYPLGFIISKILPELKEEGKEFEQKTLKKTRSPEYFDWSEFVKYLKQKYGK